MSIAVTELRSESDGFDWLPEQLKPYGHLGRWILTPVTKLPNSSEYIRQLLWYGFVTSKSQERRGEFVPVHYYGNIMFKDLNELDIRYEQAGLSLLKYPEAVMQGWAGVPTHSRTGMIYCAVDAIFSVEEQKDNLYQTIEKTNNQYEMLLKEHQSFDGVLDHEDLGWAVPIEPGVMTSWRNI